jgi:hypothetical protein
MRGCPWPAILDAKYQGRVVVPIPSESRDSSSWVARVLARYRELVRWRQSTGSENELRPSEAEVPAMPLYHYDASLLFRRMILLQMIAESSQETSLCCCESCRAFALCAVANLNACGICNGNTRPASRKTGTNTARTRRRCARSARCKTVRAPRNICSPRTCVTTTAVLSRLKEALMLDLFSRRMQTLRIDKEEIARRQPLLFCRLQLLCASCSSREECELGLADDFADVACHAYCPNAVTLRALAASRRSGLTTSSAGAHCQPCCSSVTMRAHHSNDETRSAGIVNS